MSEWILVDKWKNKPQGQVWRVRGPGGRLGYFKFARSRQWPDAGPIVGNEWLTRKLALKVGLPCARLERATLHDEGKELHGIVSLPRDDACLTAWCDLPERARHSPHTHIARCDRMAQTVAFDIWVTNIDRGSGQNVILYPGAGGLYQWYLIDHGYALYGCDRKWREHPPESRYWQQAWRFYHIPRGWKQIATRQLLMNMAARIRAIKSTDLARLVANVPDPEYSPAIKRTVTELLVSRQQSLTTLLDKWLAYPGNKEYQLR